MTWRSELIRKLSNLGEIEVARFDKNPYNVVVQRVHEFPEDTIVEFPAIVASPPQSEVVRTPGTTRSEIFRQTILIITQDANTDEMAAQGDAIRQAVVESFDHDNRLGESVSWVEGPDFDAAREDKVGEGVSVVAYPGLLVINIDTDIQEN